MATVTFQPGDKKVEAKVGDSLLSLSKKNDIGLLYSCDGAPSCALCRVSILSGDEHLNAIERKEEDLIGTSYFITKNRLSCQAKLIDEGDVEVDISEHIDRKEVKKVQKKAPPKKEHRPKERGPKKESSGKPKRKFYKKKKGKSSGGGNDQSPKNESSS